MIAQPLINQNDYISYVCDNRNSYYRLAWSFMHNEADAMDAVSQMTITIIEKCHTLRESNAFPVWSKKILINICRSKLKQNKQHELPLDPLPEPAQPRGDNSGGSDDKLLIRTAIANLSEQYKEIIIMRYYLCYEYKEIAEILNIPEGTVKSRLHRAIDKLKQEVKGE